MARILGLDIERNALRGALLRTAFRRTDVERYAQVPLSEGPDSPARGPELRTALSQLLQQLERAPDTVVASVDGRAVSLRRVSLPAAAARRVDDVLPFEMEAMLPFDVDEAVISHQPAATRDGQLDLLVAAIMDARLTHELDDLKQCGIEPQQLVPRAVALEGLVALDEPASGESPPLLVIELRRATTEICIVQGKRCQVARTLSESIDGLPGQAEMLVRGIQQTLAAFRSAGGAEPSLGVLLGEGVRGEGMDRWLTERLKMPVELAQLPKPAVGGTADATLGHAFCLAARASQPGARINLRKGRFAAADVGAGLAKQVNLLASAGVAVLVCLMFAMWSRQSLLLDEQRALSERLSATTKEVFGRSAQSVTAAEKLMKHPGSDDPLPRFDAYDALAAVSASVGGDIKHDVRRLRIEVADDKREGKLELQGSLSSIEERDEIIAALGEHPCFREIEAGRTSNARGNEAINYQLEATVQCPGDVGSKKK